MSDTSIEAVLEQVRNPAYVRVATARILLRQDLITRKEELEAELGALAGDPSIAATAPAKAAAMQALEAEIEAAKVEFRFKAIGHRAWADLLAEHPPTKTQRQQWPRIDHNPETFPVAALAASAVSPEMTVEQVQELERGLNDTQFNLLWAKCLDANTGLDAPKSAAAGAIARLNGRYAGSATAADERSLAASSSDGR